MVDVKINAPAPIGYGVSLEVCQILFIPHTIMAYSSSYINGYSSGERKLTCGRPLLVVNVIAFYAKVILTIPTALHYCPYQFEDFFIHSSLRDANRSWCCQMTLDV